MRRALVFFFILNVALSLVSLRWLPDRVAIHFGSGGRPDAWASKEIHALLLLLTQLLLFAMFFSLPWLIERLPTRWISLPHREHWLAPERAGQTYARIVRLTDELGVATLGFLAVIGLLTIDANRSQPVHLDEGLLLVTLITFVVYTLAWSARFFLAFRRRPAR
jgi:uncharacterized membrane protein